MPTLVTCRICDTALRPVVNRQTHERSNVLACPHCDAPCTHVRCHKCRR